MNVIVLIMLAAGCLIFFVLERLGVPTTLDLHFKGDVKRETRWLAQYGQTLCTLVAASLVWCLDRRRFNWALSPSVMILVGVFATRHDPIRLAFIQFAACALISE